MPFLGTSTAWKLHSFPWVPVPTRHPARHCVDPFGQAQVRGTSRSTATGGIAFALFTGWAGGTEAEQVRRVVLPGVRTRFQPVVVYMARPQPEGKTIPDW